MARRPCHINGVPNQMTARLCRMRVVFRKGIANPDVAADPYSGGGCDSTRVTTLSRRWLFFCVRCVEMPVLFRRDMGHQRLSTD